ncbi:putative fibroblast growth factor 1 isoform X2 [Genypterus blacodes]|uniref:putative fibroblast growth factor 1 isoform X2 n=1 Tax=Genypterus blacodes TaxID=154954 RepID=UPI003F757707
MRAAAAAAASCFLSCLTHTPGDTEHSGSSLSLQQHCSGDATAKPQALCRMAEGDVTVMSYAPATLDLSRHQQLTRLYCQNGGHHLRMLADGTVSGGRQDNDTHDVLRLKAVGVGVVVIKGEAAARYLAMDKDGRLYGSQAVNEECYFLEKYEENHYNTYRSQRYGWYVGLKRNGKPKAGPKTHQGQKAVYFLPRPVGDP